MGVRLNFAGVKMGVEWIMCSKLVQNEIKVWFMGINRLLLSSRLISYRVGNNLSRSIWA